MIKTIIIIVKIIYAIKVIIIISRTKIITATSAIKTLFILHINFQLILTHL